MRRVTKNKQRRNGSRFRPIPSWRVERPRGEPAILTTATWFWVPPRRVTPYPPYKNIKRRNLQTKYREQVYDFLVGLGFDTRYLKTGEIIANKADVQVSFRFSVTESGFYKFLGVWRGRKRSNITALRRFYT